MIQDVLASQVMASRLQATAGFRLNILQSLLEHIHAHTCIHMHTHACMCTRTHAYTKAYAHTHAHVRIPLDWAPPACMLLFPFSEEKLAMGEQPALFPFASLSSLTSAEMLICKFLATGELLTKAHPGV